VHLLRNSALQLKPRNRLRNRLAELLGSRSRRRMVAHGKPSHGFTESEVTGRRCDAHLAICSMMGRSRTGLRYCIDSVALRFVATR
jgi:hypothetical protein